MAIDPSRNDLLVYAAMASDPDSIARHLGAGAVVDFIHPDYGTALVQAVRVSNDAAVDLLLQAGADPNLKIPGSDENAMTLGESSWCSQHIWQALRDHGGTPREPPASHHVSFAPPGPVDAPAWFWRLFGPFETKCVLDCCGWQAFDFSESAVRVLLAQGHSLAQMKEDLEQALAYTDACMAPVPFKGYNMYWGKEGATAILYHLREIFDLVSGHP